MAYDNKTHCNTHQLKSRLNDDAYAAIKAEAADRETQPGALVRDLTLAALQFKNEHGYFPLVDGYELADPTLDAYPMLRDRARELKVSPRQLASDLIQAALDIKLEHAQSSSAGDEKRTA